MAVRLTVVESAARATEFPGREAYVRARLTVVESAARATSLEMSTRISPVTRLTVVESAARATTPCVDAEQLGDPPHGR